MIEGRLSLIAERADLLFCGRPDDDADVCVTARPVGPPEPDFGVSSRKEESLKDSEARWRKRAAARAARAVVRAEKERQLARKMAAEFARRQEQARVEWADSMERRRRVQRVYVVGDNFWDAVRRYESNPELWEVY